MNKLNPKKLLHSKWTHLSPQNRERHFLVVGTEVDEEGRVINCAIEAVISRRQYAIDWRELTDQENWQAGWL